MDVIRAETAGFCMGVNMALQKLDALVAEADDTSPIFTLGPIIHNPQVLAAYERRGVRVARDPSEIPAGARVVIRAHGIPVDVEAALAERGATVADATCPKVKKAQLLIRRCSEGRTLLLYGERSHPEVQGLLSYARGDTIVFETPEELFARDLSTDCKYCLAAQTTQDRALFEVIVERLKARPGMDLFVLRTICDATRQRQEEAIALAATVEIMVVVGGRSSGNTRRLAQVVSDHGTPAVHVETAAELDPERFRGIRRAGLTAGASTPRHIIVEAERTLAAMGE